MQGESRKAFFAVAGLPRERRNFDGSSWDDSVVHALPVVVVVDDTPSKAPPLPALPRRASRAQFQDPTLVANLGNLVRCAPSPKTSFGALMPPQFLLQVAYTPFSPVTYAPHCPFPVSVAELQSPPSGRASRLRRTGAPH